jgi:hypothetical protein
MLTVTFDGRAYDLPLQEVLSDLTGEESAVIEDYLGGWDRFRTQANATRTMIVMVWLAKRHAGEHTTLQEIANTKGLVFGNAVQLEGDPEDPEDPKQPPNRPLAETNAKSASSAGSAASEATPATSDSSGQLPSPASTG